MIEAGRVAALLVGVAIVLATFGSAIRTVVLPRGNPARITRLVFRSMRRLFSIRIGRHPTYERIDRVLAPFAPLSLITLVFVWLALVMVGYSGIYLIDTSRSITDAIILSGSSLATLGFVHPGQVGGVLLVLSEAAVGLVIIALLITYLPSIYGAFSRREQVVAYMDTRAGSPPSAAALIVRFWAIEWLEEISDLWAPWESWFIDLQETHTTFPSLAFFRSPEPDQSWITSAGVMLDTASLVVSMIDRPRDPAAELFIRSGYLALRRIATQFPALVPFPPDPAPTDPISVAREEFDEVWHKLEAAGVPLVDEPDDAWAAFKGWRVNYDAVLIGLARLTNAPYAAWVSDRSIVSAGPRRSRRRA
ncbi:MAG: two pore domain potassium channel family protein [Actinobacteria bacterium]|nr:two pore domain potassium channel family protein [Actinomycetota bacterium]